MAFLEERGAGRDSGVMPQLARTPEFFRLPCASLRTRRVVTDAKVRSMPATLHGLHLPGFATTVREMSASR